MGRWPGHHYAGALPPASGLGGAQGSSCAHTVAKVAVTSRARVLARRSICSASRPFSTSPWKHGTLARSPACMCAAACVGIRRGQGSSCAHTAEKRGSHKPNACAGTAQGMFRNARAFNQPVAAWDVGQVTSMSVRRRPCRGRVPLCTQLLREATTSRACVLTRRRICSGLNIIKGAL